MTNPPDPRETRSRDEREAALFAVLGTCFTLVKDKSPYYTDTLKDFDAQTLTSREALATLPVLRKSDLIAGQGAVPPFGGLGTQAPNTMARLFLSPGPIAEPQGNDGDTWRFSRALRAAGFTAGDITHNCFSYHLTPAGFMFDSAARALGCSVFPGGTGNTEQQALAMRRYGANAYAGTPDFLKTILEKAEEINTPVTSVKKASVGGGPLFPDLRAWYEDRGISCLQNYGTADAGLIAYETPAKDGLVIDEDVLVEIVRPGTGDPVPEGEAGEVVVTVFDPAYPLIRFATGDLSAVLSGPCPTGRTNMRLKGWMGRADQTTKVKGIFVHPEQIARVAKAHGFARIRLEVTESGGRDSMVLICEGSGDTDTVTATLQSETRLRGDVKFAAAGTLPNDGKVIDDQRAL